MIALAGLPVALALGALADLAAGAVLWPLGRGRPLDRVATPVAAAIRLARRPEPVGVLEAAGAFAAMAAGGAAAAAAIGGLPGSLPALALLLLASSGGLHLTLADPTTRARADRLRPLGLETLAFEVAFLAALAAAFLRWRAADLEAVRGAQAVLGPGVVVGPAGRAAALGLALAVLVVAAAGRVAPADAVAPARGFSPAAATLAALARWTAVGSAALVAGALAFGPELPSLSVSPRLAGWVGGAVVSAVLVGAASAALALVPPRGPWRLLPPLGLAAAAAGALALAFR